MTRSFLLVVLLAVAVVGADTPSQPAAYFNDFKKTPPGKPPADWLVLVGEFTVKAEGNNHYLEVFPDPLDSFGLLFGPDGITLADVSAKIYATSTGRRFPDIGVGCGDAGGYKLILSPGQSMLELRRGDDAVAAQAPFDTWKSGQWFSFRIKVSPAGEGKWRIGGKVWPSTDKEPEGWSISYDTKEAPSAGRASIWAIPFSETPVRFDDLSVTGPSATEKPG